MCEIKIESQSGSSLESPNQLLLVISTLYHIIIVANLFVINNNTIYLTDPAAEEYEMKSWLSNSNSPKSQVLQYMKDTFNLRSLEIKNTTNLIDTLNEWPHLLETSGVVSVTLYYLQK